MALYVTKCHHTLLGDRVSERCNQLEQERDALHLVSEEAQRNLSKYEEVLKISSDDIEMSDVKLGGGSYGGRCSGL